MKNPMHILIVEDNPSDAELMVRRLRMEGLGFTWVRVDDEESFRSALDAGYDLVLSDWSLPDFSGLRALQIFRERDLETPFIIISGSIGEEAAVDALHRGASDYLLKDRPERLGQAVRNAIEKRSLREEQIKAEKLLQLQSAALNAAANAIVITDLNGAIEWINPAFTTLTGYTPDEALGKNPRDLISSGQHNGEFFKKLWDTILAGKVWRGEIINRRKNGSTYFEELTITPVLDALGQINRFIAIKQDINSRKLAEEKLGQSEERYRNLVELSPDAIIVHRDYQLVFVNPAALELFGATTAEQLVGKDLFGLFHEDHHDFIRERIQRKLTGEEASNRSEEIIIRLDGTTREVDVVAAPFKDAQGGAIQVILRDVTERKEAERLVRLTSDELRVAYDATLQGWSNALELRERETAGHSQRVVQTTLQVARLLGVPDQELVHIQRGALLHDIGKMGIPDSILLKPGPLNNDEWDIMRQHPIYAYNLLAPIPYLKPALDIPHYHHERWNGSGYPEGLKGEEIPLAARIFAVIDVWDALSYDRPYRSAWTPEAVLAYLRENSGILFDPNVVRAVLTVLEIN